MALSPGIRLGVYEVAAKIGEGGMGEVYRARDTTLDRDVALKVLPEAFTEDPDRLARFEREAKVLASLNHPNIGHIYGLEEAGDIRALVLELVEGPTLADRIAQGAIPVDEALPIATQIAEALEAAHEQGVIHRDLKPANIKVRGDGTVKVLDFGLAKTAEVAATANPDESPTITETQIGVVLGTAAYMSPEQARGRPVDRRTDLWAFGCVLFEMLTGHAPFKAGDVSLTISKVLQQEPAWSLLPATVPTTVTAFLRQSLEKAPHRRVQSAGDLRVALEGGFVPDLPVDAPTSAAPASRKVGLMAVVALVALAGIAGWWFGRPEISRSAPVRLSIALPALQEFTNYGVDLLAVSPDGRRVAFLGDQRLWVRELDTNELDWIEEVGDGLTLTNVFFSPDGQWVGYYLDGRMQKIAVSGGAPVELTPVGGFPLGASWTDAGDIFFGRPDGVWRVADTGGREAELVVPLASGETPYRPQMLPGGEWVLYTSLPDGETDWDRAQAVLYSPGTGERRVVLDATRDTRLLDGYLVYALGTTVYAQAFDSATLAVSGTPMPLVGGVYNAGATSGSSHFDLTDAGTLVFLPVPEQPQRSRLLAVDRDTDVAPEVLVEVNGNAWYPRFSPSGDRLAYALAPGEGAAGEADLYVRNLATAREERLTRGDNNRFFPVWSPEGDRLAYGAGSGATNRVLVVSADGGSQPQVLVDRNRRQFPMSWSAAAGGIALYQHNTDTSRDIYLLATAPSASPEPLISSAGEDRGVSFSPDGRWLTFSSNVSGAEEVYVRSMEDATADLGTLVSSGGGTEPVWAPDGRELFFRAADQLMVVSFDPVTGRPGVPRVLRDDPFLRDNAAGGGGNPNYDVAPDGDRFVFVESIEGTTVHRRIDVVLNWQSALLDRGAVP